MAKQWPFSRSGLLTTFILILTSVSSQQLQTVAKTCGRSFKRTAFWDSKSATLLLVAQRFLLAWWRKDPITSCLGLGSHSQSLSLLKTFFPGLDCCPGGDRQHDRYELLNLGRTVSTKLGEFVFEAYVRATGNGKKNAIQNLIVLEEYGRLFLIVYQGHTGCQHESQTV